MNENKDEWIANAKKKLETVGNIKTVKYVREETGMSLLEAKQFVDSLEGDIIAD
ncbi:MAG TPA: ribosomal protein L7/L12 [Candidatus Paenibacillus intestinavium]|nr:ribosomal protein L7/L12 [Candidatus Paenibacillus intestinavium]